MDTYLMMQPSYLMMQLTNANPRKTYTQTTRTHSCARIRVLFLYFLPLVLSLFDPLPPFTPTLSYFRVGQATKGSSRGVAPYSSHPHPLYHNPPYSSHPQPPCSPTPTLTYFRVGQATEESPRGIAQQPHQCIAGPFLSGTGKNLARTTNL